jgi:hypothetical protein
LICYLKAIDSQNPSGWGAAVNVSALQQLHALGDEMNFNDEKCLWRFI